MFTKNVVLKIVVFLLSMLPSFIVFSFIAWDVNAGNWGFEFRTMAAAVSLIVASLIVEAVFKEGNNGSN